MNKPLLTTFFRFTIGETPSYSFLFRGICAASYPLTLSGVKVSRFKLIRKKTRWLAEIHFHRRMWPTMSFTKGKKLELGSTPMNLATNGYFLSKRNCDGSPSHPGCRCCTLQCSQYSLSIGVRMLAS